MPATDASRGFDRSMRRWADVAEAVRATRKTSEKVASVADYLRSLDLSRSRDRGRIPLRPAVPRARPAHDGPGLVGDRGGRAAPWPELAPDAPERGVRALLGPRDIGRRAAGVGGASTAGRDPTARTGRCRRRLRVGRGGPRTRGEAVDPARALRALRSAHRALCRRDPLGRAAHRPAGGASGGRRSRARSGGSSRPSSGPACSPATSARPPSWRAAMRSTAPELALFHPLKSCSRRPVADEAEALARLPPPVWVEDKYDGIRAQLHKQGAEVRLFSRDLHDVTGQFPEVVAAAAAAAVGRHPRRRAARLAGRSGAAVPPAPGDGSGASRPSR